MNSHRAAVTVRPGPAWEGAQQAVAVPAFWLLVAVSLVGGWQVLAMLHTGAAAYPVATGFAVVLFALYAVPFVLVARSLDFFEREPPHLLAAAFGWGGLVATATCVRADEAAHDLLAKLVSPAFATVWGPAVTGPTIEEPVKVLGVVAIGLVARSQINSVVDGFVYGAFVGLGFQVVEDVMYAVNGVALAGRGDAVGPVAVVFLLRGFLGGLWSHTLFSALAGSGVAYLVLHRDRWGLVRFAGSLLGAWGFHALWNSPLLADGFGHGTAGVLAALLLKGTPALLVILLLVRSAGQREAGYYLRQLVGEPEVATVRELSALATGRTRLAARRLAYARGGWKLANRVKQLQRAQARLALDLSRDLPRAAEHREEVRALRRWLVAAGHPDSYAPDGPGTAGWGWVGGCLGAAVLALLVAAAIRALGGG